MQEFDISFLTGGTHVIVKFHTQLSAAKKSLQMSNQVWWNCEPVFTDTKQPEMVYL